MNIVHHEGVSLFLPKIELIQGTGGCYNVAVSDNVQQCDGTLAMDCGYGIIG